MLIRLVVSISNSSYLREVVKLIICRSAKIVFVKVLPVEEHICTFAGSRSIDVMSMVALKVVSKCKDEFSGMIMFEQMSAFRWMVAERSVVLVRRVEMFGSFMGFHNFDTLFDHIILGVDHIQTFIIKIYLCYKFGPNAM